MSRDVFVWDTTGPCHATRCGHLDWLLDAAGRQRRHMIPQVVAEEMVRNGCVADGFDDVVDVELDELLNEAVWQGHLGSGRNHGEAAVVVLAQHEHGVAIIDDLDARQVIRTWEPALEVHGVLWAISRGVVEGRVPGPQAYSGLCDAMLETGVRWPIQPGGYADWYEKNRRHLA